MAEEFGVRESEFAGLMICMPRDIGLLARPRTPVLQIGPLASAKATFGGALRRLVVDRPWSPGYEGSCLWWDEYNNLTLLRIVGR